MLFRIGGYVEFIACLYINMINCTISKPRFSINVRINSTRRHFGLNWAFVDPRTPIHTGVKFCVCVKELFPWLMMPLQVVYVNENRSPKKAVASFGFGSGTLSGHLLVSFHNMIILISLEIML